MAFLCPVRIRRNKKKKPLDDESMHGAIPSMGRITGSASIETLVRVGIEKENGLGPESKMVVLHDFTPCVDDELEVKRGQIVHVLYQENDWVYVISEENQEGFIPHSYCAQYGSQLATLALNVKKKMPRVTPPSTGGGGFSKPSHYQPSSQNQFISHQTTGSNENIRSGSEGQHTQNSSMSATHHARGKVNLGLEQSDNESNPDSKLANKLSTRGQLQGNKNPVGHMVEPITQTEILPFFKDPSGRYVVLYSYSAQDENDVSVERGQCVTVLNSDDPDWFWVKRYDQQEGFVPSGFIYPLDAIQRQQGFSINSVGPGSSSYNPIVQSNYPQQHFQASSFPLQQQQSGLVVQSVLSHPRPMQSHNTTWNGGSAGSSGPPSFTNIHHSQYTPTLSSITGNSYAGDLAQSSKGLRPQSSLSAGTSLPTSSAGPAPPLSITPGPPSQNGLPSADLCYNGTELVVLYDYKAQAPDDLTVRRGDWVYADLNNQTVDGWLWTYAPKTRKYGFIPKAYAKPPAMTSL